MLGFLEACTSSHAVNEVHQYDLLKLASQLPLRGTVYAYFKACGFRCAYQTIADQHGFQGSFPAYTTWAGWASGDYMATCDHIFISKGIEVSSVLWQ